MTAWWCWSSSLGHAQIRRRLEKLAPPVATGHSLTCDLFSAESHHIERFLAGVKYLDIIYDLMHGATFAVLPSQVSIVIASDVASSIRIELTHRTVSIASQSDDRFLSFFLVS